MRLGMLVLLAGCGRLGFTDQRSAPTDGPAADGIALDVPALPDAAMLIEVVTVPVDGTAAISTIVLGSGVHYTLVASGTFTAVPPAVDPLGDAEYYDMTDTAGGGPKDIDTTNMIDFGLAIDTPTVGLTKTPATWGAYRDDHIYTVDFIGKGAKLRAQIFDCCYGDNVGTLTLQIYR